MRNLLGKRPLFFVLLFVIVVNFAIVIPDILGLIQSNANLQYSNIANIEVNDLNAYFAWTKQSSDGSWNFSDLFTTEQSSGFLHPVFLTLGKLIKLGINLPWLWLGFRFLCNCLLTVVIYKFTLTLTHNHTASFWSMALTTLAGGFGWLVGNLSADSAQMEATVFQSLRWPFMYALATTLLLLAIKNAWKFLETKQTKFAVWAGAWGLFLSFVHLYDMVVLYPVVGVLFLVSFLQDRSWFTLRNFAKASLVFLLPLPGLVYYYWLFTHDWVFMANTQFAMLGSGPIYYLLGFGVLPYFALLGVWFMLKNNTYKKSLRLLLTWFLVQFTVILLPLSIQRKLIMGLIVPLGILAGMGIAELVRRLLAEQISKTLKLTVVTGLTFTLVLGSLSSASVVAQDILNVETKSFPYFFDQRLVGSLTWLDSYEKEGNVIASIPIGNIVPRFTGRHVFAGHWAQTINAGVKYKTVDQFYESKFSTPKLIKFMQDNNLKFVIWSEQETILYGNDWISSNSNFEVVYSNDYIKIYEFND